MRYDGNGISATGVQIGMRKAAACLILFLGCRTGPEMAWPLGVTYQAKASCPSPLEGLLALKNQRGATDFFRWTRFGGLLERGLVLPDIVPIASRDQVSAALVSPPGSAVTASISIGRQNFNFVGGTVEAQEKGADAEVFANEIEALFPSLATGAPEWVIQSYMEWHDLGRVISFLRSLGIQEVVVCRHHPEKGFREQPERLSELGRTARPLSFSSNLGSSRLICQPQYGGGVAFWITCGAREDFVRLAARWGEVYR